MIIISAHSDTNFKKVNLEIDGEYYVGYLDNYIGVYSVMKAYFSGKMNFDHVRVELTYGEEIDMAGAKKVAEEITPDDLVIVVDVTATPTTKDFVIEKCESKKLRFSLEKALIDFSYDLYKSCPDPISNKDEIDVYKQKTDNYFFLGLPCTGGDYNRTAVRCKIRSVDEVAQAIIRICKNYKVFH